VRDGCSVPYIADRCMKRLETLVRGDTLSFARWLGRVSLLEEIQIVIGNMGVPVVVMRSRGAFGGVAGAGVGRGRRPGEHGHRQG
jgi:hypothetical protein